MYLRCFITFFVCLTGRVIFSTYALIWFFPLLFQMKKLRFEKLWFDNVRNYNMTNYRMKYYRRLSSPRVENHRNFRQKKSEEEEKDLFWSCRVNFNHFFRKIWHSVGTFTFSHVTKTKNIPQLMIWIFLFLSKHA